MAHGDDGVGARGAAAARCSAGDDEQHERAPADEDEQGRRRRPVDVGDRSMRLDVDLGEHWQPPVTASSAAAARALGWRPAGCS